MPQLTSRLLQRGQRLPQQAETLGQRLKVAQSAEYKKVRKLRESKQETNPYHKAQYISAFIEAHSAELTHSSLSKNSAAVEMDRRIAAIAPTELFLSPGTPGSGPDHTTGAAASQSGRWPSQSSQHSPRNGVTNSWEQPPPSLVPGAHRHDHHKRDVSFGDWRGVPAPIAKQAASVDFLTHCVLREGATPPAWSPHALHRALCVLPCAKVVLGLASHIDTLGRQPRKRLTVDGDRLVASFTRCRHSVRASMSDCASDVVTSTLRMADSFLLQLLVFRLGPVTALHVLTHKLRYAEPGDCSLAPSQLIAVYAEAVRQCQPTVLGASFQLTRDTLGEMLDHAAHAASVTSRSSRHPHCLEPVAAAPLLSLMCGPSLSAADVRELTEKYIMKPTAGRRYLPAVAWGAYVGALYRCGADLGAVQSEVDRITDPAVTKNSEALLRSPHLWRAYIESCAPQNADHALSVFEENAAHYHVERTPAVTAAVMQVLLASPDRRHWDKAAEVWKASLGRFTSKVTPIVSVMCALSRLYERQDDLAALARLCTDFGGFYSYYGVAADQWQDAGGDALGDDAVRIFRERGPAPLEAVLGRLENAEALQPVIPPRLVEQLRTSLEALTVGRASAADGRTIPGLTAETLADLL